VRGFARCLSPEEGETIVIKRRLLIASALAASFIVSWPAHAQRQPTSQASMWTSFPTWNKMVEGASDLIITLAGKPAEFAWKMKMRTFLTSLNSNVMAAKAIKGDLLYWVSNVDCREISSEHAAQEAVDLLDDLSVDLARIESLVAQLRQSPIYDSHQNSTTKVVDAVSEIRRSRKGALFVYVPQWCSVNSERKSRLRLQLEQSINDATAGIAATNFLLTKLQ
jgi:hypothetical protein